MRAFTRIAALSACALGLGAALAAPGSPPAVRTAQGTVVLKAGTVLPVDGPALTGGATVLIRGGKIVAVGADLAVPPGARVVDYGPSAVIAPGLVAASSNFGIGPSSPRTADLDVRAVDNFDFLASDYAVELAAGVTTAYLQPSTVRLIGGVGAVVKLAGSALSAQVLSDSASIHGTIGSEARNVPGYWEPPIPATVDVGLGVAEPQLPMTTMGAIVALEELLAAARGGADSGAYGPHVAARLKELMGAGVQWRIGAGSAEEIRSLLGFAERSELVSLTIDGGAESGALAGEIAAAGASVVIKVDVSPQAPGQSYGRGPDARWPRYDNAVQLARAGVPFAIATPDTLRPRDLRFAAMLASRGGLSDEQALRAITLGAAEVLGVQDRVGSLTAGKDADLAVFAGSPMGAGSSVLATWVDGALAWEPKTEGSASSDSGRRRGSRSVVIEAEQVYLGDGEVLSPGQVLIRDGKIAAVGRSVGRPAGAAVVRGQVAMPGMIDAFGHLGLDGSGRSPSTDFKMKRIVEPGDHDDRRVARSGVTTVMLAPRGGSNSGVPILAYKPAGSDVDEMVIDDPAALRVFWTERDRIESGNKVRELLTKAAEYVAKWAEYEKAIAEWTPPPPEEAAASGDEEKKDEEAGSDEEKGEDEEKKDDKGKKKNGDKDVDALNGIWEGDVVVPPFTDEAHLRLRLEHEQDTVTGSLRCDSVSERLVVLAGRWDGEASEFDVSGFGTRGPVRIQGKVAKGKLEGTLALGATEVKLAAERTTTELKYVRRPEPVREKKDDEKPPKGKPKEPGIDEKLEPLRRAMRGELAVIVDVEREDEILACVDAFEEVGIRPILFGAGDAWRVAGEIRGRVAGVLLSHQVLETEERGGLSSLRNRHAELVDAGIPVAFHSSAEEGASDLPLHVAYAISQGLSPEAALRGLTSGAARMLAIDDRVGRLAAGLDGDVLLLDGPPLHPSTSVLRAWVNGREVR